MLNVRQLSPSAYSCPLNKTKPRFGIGEGDRCSGMPIASFVKEQMGLAQASILNKTDRYTFRYTDFFTKPKQIGYHSETVSTQEWMRRFVSMADRNPHELIFSNEDALRSVSDYDLKTAETLGFLKKHTLKDSLPVMMKGLHQFWQKCVHNFDPPLLYAYSVTETGRRFAADADLKSDYAVLECPTVEQLFELVNKKENKQ